MKFKLVNSNFDKETGISSATIATELGFFTGYSRLHEEDKQNISTFCGCRYAELRAMLKYIKKRISLYSYQIKTLNNYLLYLKSKKDFDKNSLECKNLYKYMNQVIKEKKSWEVRGSNLSAAILKNINDREVALKKLNKTHFKD